MISLLSKGNLLAVLRNEEKWEILISLNDSFKIERFIYNKSINKLLKELACYYHRSFIEERKIMSEQYDFQQKIPILINPGNILLFQTRSLDHSQCILLNYYCINKYKKVNDNIYIDFCVPFKNKKIILNDGIYIHIDRRTIDNQYKRCQRIENTLKERNII